MTLQEMYGYLVRTRRDLRATLEATPEDVLSRPLIAADRFRCLKDMLFHVIEVEDGWVQGDIRRVPMIQEQFPSLRELPGGPVFADVPLALLLDYWSAVENETHAYLATLTESDLMRAVPVEDWPEKQLTVHGLLWHVMIHEIRHSAQMVVLLRNAGVRPPSLDLLFYL
ncbi:DinB family protein [Gemmatimonas sp.]